MNQMTPEQCRAARARLGISQDHLSMYSLVAGTVVNGFECEHGNIADIDRIPRCLEAMCNNGKLIEFWVPYDNAYAG